MSELLDRTHPLPWHTEGDGYIYDKDGNGIACCLREIEEKHDARRIVTCVNACAGLTDNQVAVLGSLLRQYMKENGELKLNMIIASVCLQRIANLPPERMDEAHAMALTAIADIKETVHE